MTFLEWMIRSGTGRLVAGLLLYVAFKALEHAPGAQRRWLCANPLRKRVVSVFMASAPALIALLFTDVPMKEIATALIGAVLMSSGINAWERGKLDKKALLAQVAGVADLSKQEARKKS